MPHLLYLEHDPEIRAGIDQHLRREGFVPVSFGLGKEGLAHLAECAEGRRPLPRAILLDVALPDLDGLQLLRRLRAEPRLAPLPVLLLTSRSEDIDRVLCLELRAEDYIPRPYSGRELVARIRAILRRAAVAESEKPVHHTYGPIRLDPEQRAAFLRDALLDLTRREYELLEFLVRNPHRVHSREHLLHEVWGLDYLGESRTIDAHVRRLRAKLGPDAALIATVVGAGYRLGEGG